MFASLLFNNKGGKNTGSVPTRSLRLDLRDLLVVSNITDANARDRLKAANGVPTFVLNSRKPPRLCLAQAQP